MKKNSSLAILLLIVCIDIIGLGLVLPLFAPMLFGKDFSLVSPETSNGTRGFYFGVLIALFSIGQFLSSPILGKFSDRFGRKKILVFCLLIGILANGISAIGVLYQNLYSLYISRALIGFSAGSAAVVEAALVDISSTPAEKTKYFGYFNAAMGIGFTIGPFLGGIFSSISSFKLYGFVIPFLFGVLINLLALFPVLLFYKESHLICKIKKSSSFVSSSDLRKIFKIKGMAVLLSCMFFYFLGWGVYFEFVSVYLIKKYHFDPLHIGYFYGYSALLYALFSSTLITPIVNQLGTKNALLYSTFLAGLVAFILLFIQDPFFVWFFLPPFIFLLTFPPPTSTTLVSNLVEQDMQGEALGIYQSVQCIAWAAAPLIFGAVIGIYSSMPIVIGGSILILSALLYGIYNLLERK